MALKGLVFECPVCESPFRVTREMAGKRVACPHCDSAIRVQLPQTAQQPRPETSTDSDREGEPYSNAMPPAPSPMQSTAADRTPPADERSEGRVASDPSASDPSASEPVNPMGIPVFRETLDSSSTSTDADDSIRSGATGPSPADSMTRESRSAIAPVPLATELPPKFDVADPERSGAGSGRTTTTIVLPDAEEGTRTVDARRIHVLYRGEWVELTARSPEEAIRYRRRVNVISILVGIALVALAIAILLW